jgi:hypothetical protein
VDTKISALLGTGKMLKRVLLVMLVVAPGGLIVALLVGLVLKSRKPANSNSDVMAPVRFDYTDAILVGIALVSLTTFFVVRRSCR